MLSSQHPSEETLAMFVDDRLDSASHDDVLAHIASCGECRELVLMTSDLRAEENVVPGPFVWHKWMAAVAGVAAAAVIGFVALQPVLVGPSVDKVVAAVGTLEKRPSAGRLAGLSYKVANEPKRGPEDEKHDRTVAFYQVAADLEEAKFPNAHAVGLVTLGLAENGADVKKAVDLLSSAYEKAEGDERDAIAIDLAAARLARLYWVDSKEDAQSALDLSEEVLKRKQSPEALWNRAVALESLDEKAAIGAWDDYLKLDPNSEWSVEAQHRRNNLAEFP
jgi:hypothetical protein